LDCLKSIGDVRSSLQLVIEEFGFTGYVITGIAPAANEKLENLVLASTFPGQFIQEYSRCDYVRGDPLVRKARNVSLPFDWHNRLSDTTWPSESKLIALRKDVGIDRISVFPLRGPQGYEACLAAVGGDVELSDSERAVLHLVGIYGLIRARSFANVLHVKPQELTEREREVLTWVAQGKSAWEVGEILGISKRTVDEHSKTAFQKLHAVNRAQAVAIALQSRFINV
jgi:LuxR family quorum sensing-dependent transcriptional regulator